MIFSPLFPDNLIFSIIIRLCDITLRFTLKWTRKFQCDIWEVFYGYGFWVCQPISMQHSCTCMNQNKAEFHPFSLDFLHLKLILSLKMTRIVVKKVGCHIINEILHSYELIPLVWSVFHIILLKSDDMKQIKLVE